MVPSPSRVSSSVKALWTEALLSKGVRHLHLEPLTPKERIWICNLIGPHKPSLGGTYVRKPNSLRWQIRKNPKNFSNWWTKLECHSLFFDGASKGNLRLAGAGGVIFYPRGNRLKYYAWRIGKNSNNYAEWLALFKGMEIANMLGTKIY